MSIDDNNIGGSDNQLDGVQDNNADDGRSAGPNPGAIRKSYQKSILNVLSNASGQQFDSIEAAAAWAARVAAGNVNGDTAQSTGATQKTQKTAKDPELTEQFSQLKARLDKAEHEKRELQLNNDVRGIMGDRFDEDLAQYAIQKVMQSIVWDHEEGTYSVTNAKGQLRYDEKTGEPMTLRALVDEVAKSNPKFLKARTSSQGGSGFRPGQGNAPQFGADAEDIPDPTVDLAGWKAAMAARGGLPNQGLKGVGVKVRPLGQVG